MLLIFIELFISMNSNKLKIKALKEVVFQMTREKYII